MARSGNTFSFASAISTWANPGPGDVFSISGWNNLRQELIDGLSQSLRNDGGGNMTGPLKLDLGSETDPALAFNAETGTGFYRISAGLVGLAIGGTLRYTFKSGAVVADNNTTVLTSAAVQAAITGAGAFTQQYGGIYLPYSADVIPGSGAYVDVNSSLLGKAWTSLLTPAGVTLNTTTGFMTVTDNGVHELTAVVVVDFPASRLASFRFRTNAPATIAGSEVQAGGYSVGGLQTVTLKTLVSLSAGVSVNLQFSGTGATTYGLYAANFFIRRVA